MNESIETKTLRRIRLARVVGAFGIVVSLFGLMGIIGSIYDSAHPGDRPSMIVTGMVFITIGAALWRFGQTKKTRARQALPSGTPLKARPARTPGTATWRIRELVRWALWTPSGAAATITALFTSVRFPFLHGAPAVLLAGNAASVIAKRERAAQMAQAASLAPAERSAMCMASGEDEAPKPPSASA